MGFWKEFFSNLDEPAITIQRKVYIVREEYICNDCEYIWTSRKSVGIPCKCPDCGSRNIEEY